MFCISKQMILILNYVLYTKMSLASKLHQNYIFMVLDKKKPLYTINEYFDVIHDEKGFFFINE